MKFIIEITLDESQLPEEKQNELQEVALTQLEGVLYNLYWYREGQDVDYEISMRYQPSEG